ncbi:MAG: NAD(P)-binding protein, partial [Acidimicrobiia bacterium]|nr:NAD(P)-binding protein [Acidimicrobiia bacterium]
MTLSPSIEPITEDDETLAGVLEHASISPLLAALAQVTGDLGLLRDDLRPDPATLRMPEAGLTPAQEDAGRALAREALGRFRDGGCTLAPPPDSDQLRRMMEFAVGSDAAAMDEYLPLLREELALAGEDLRAPDWHKSSVDPARPFLVAVIGAGMSGLLCAHRLQQAGIDYVVCEKNADVGGTWLENTYPGCRVDVSNELYSYSFARREWPQHFSTQPVLLDYFRACADELGLRPHIRFGTEVRSARFDGERSVWDLRLATP